MRTPKKNMSEDPITATLIADSSVADLYKRIYIGDISISEV
jgi:hypothetical protein